MIPTYVGYNSLHIFCTELAKQIQRNTQHKVDCVVGLTRGGLIPAVIISHFLDLPVIPVNYSSKYGMGDNRNHDNILPKINYKSILFTDDVCDSGKTLIELYEHYHDIPHKQTAVLYYKQTAIFKPDYYVHVIPKDFPWIVFPWEIIEK